MIMRFLYFTSSRKFSTDIINRRALDIGGDYKDIGLDLFCQNRAGQVFVDNGIDEDEFLEIEKKFPNFKFNIALSEPQPEDNWNGYTGF